MSLSQFLLQSDPNLGNVLTQAALAAITPVIEVQDGSNYNHTYIKPDSDIAIPQLGCYHHWVGDRKTPRHFPCKSVREYSDTEWSTQQAIAHRYGDAGRDTLTNRSLCGDYKSLSGQIPYRYHCKDDAAEFAYRFTEYNPNDILDAYPKLTNRVIKASSGKCLSYNSTELRLIQVQDGANLRNTISAWNYTYTNGSFQGDIIIPVAHEAFDGTTYIYRGKDIPQNEKQWSCGDRCLWMWAHLNPGPYFRDNRSIFYQCPITISPVENAIRPEQIFSDGMARLAAASIALQGRRGGNWQQWTQYQFYPVGTAWEIHNGGDDRVGPNMAEFAIASISTLAIQNSRVIVSADQPNLSSYLDFRWGFVIPLTLFVACIHIGLFLTMWYFDTRPSKDKMDMPLIRKDTPSNTASVGSSLGFHPQ
ncbi:MAG: hypothetical protein M1814_006567 [Vezdaea aestivalis]|nr:MAG: hypothetical protein M1814_006567 [Vezdaea aestivalis]